MMPMRLAEINDDNLRAYLAGRLTVAQLGARMHGIEPYEIRDGEVVALTREELAAKNRARLEANLYAAAVRSGKQPGCRHATFTDAPAKGCASCKGVAVVCGHPGRHGLAANSQRCTAEGCKFFEAGGVGTPQADGKAAKAGKVLVLKRAGYDKPFTRQLVTDLQAAGWTVEEMDTSGGLPAVRARIEAGDKPDALLRWEEHGCLFVTAAWRDFVAYLYRWDVAPLSIDLGYFAHYRALMVDRYRRADARSTILDEWAGIDDDPETAWAGAPQAIVEYRDGVRAAYRQARVDGPLDDLEPGYVLVFLQFSAALARQPFGAANMIEWARQVTTALQEAGERVVLKASPVGPWPEIAGVPCYAAKQPVEAGEGLRVKVDPQLNARLAAHCKYAVINSSSVSNELVIGEVRTVALGQSWFNGLGVFAEPETWEGVCRAPEIDRRAQAKWIRWWLRRQGGMGEAPRLAAARLAEYRADPYDYAALYGAVYAATPNYGGEQARTDHLAAAIIAMKPEQVLDVGCGQGCLVARLLAEGIDAYGLDVTRAERTRVPGERFVEGSALALPDGDKAWDVVACSDMLEHLRPSDVIRALAEIRRETRRYAVFSVGCCKAGWPSPSGWPNLHLTVRTFHAWQAAIEAAGFRIVRAEYRAATDNMIVAEPVKPVAPAKMRPVAAGRFAPKTIDLFLTQDCNCRCSYCYVEHTPARLDAATACRAVDWLLGVCPVDTARICFFGGEPLLEFDRMREIVEYGDVAAKKAGKRLRYMMTTNGTIWSDEIAAWIRGHKVGVNLSCDGRPETQDRYRALRTGEPTYPLVVRTLKALLDMRGRQNVRLTYTAENVHELGANVRHVWELGAQSVHPAAAVNTAWTDERLAVLERELRDLARETIERGPENYRRCGAIAKPVAKLVAAGKRPKGYRQRAKYQCGAGHSYLAVACDGGLYPCHRFVGMGAYRLGDLSGHVCEVNADLWSLYDANSLFPGCYGCPSRGVCAGGCPAVTYQATGYLDTPSLIQCAITRIETDVARWVLANCDDPEMVCVLTGKNPAKGNRDATPLQAS